MSVSIPTILIITFIVGPSLLTLFIVIRYSILRVAIRRYASLFHELIYRLESGKELWGELGENALDPLPAEAPNGSSPVHQPGFLQRLWASIRIRRQMGQYEEQVSQEQRFQFLLKDYLGAVQSGSTPAERWATLRRKNLQIHEELIEHVEFCRTATETLPYIGILGTLLGFLFSLNDISASFTSGLILAMSSTAIALLYILIVKLFFEGRIIPRYIQLENIIKTVEEYSERFGTLVEYRSPEKA